MRRMLGSAAQAWFSKATIKMEIIFRRVFDVTWLGSSLYLISNYRLFIWPEDILEVPDDFFAHLTEMSAREATSACISI